MEGTEPPKPPARARGQGQDLLQVRGSSPLQPLPARTLPLQRQAVSNARHANSQNHETQLRANEPAKSTPTPRSTLLARRLGRPAPADREVEEQRGKSEVPGESSGGQGESKSRIAPVAKGFSWEYDEGVKFPPLDQTSASLPLEPHTVFQFLSRPSYQAPVAPPLPRNTDPQYPSGPSFQAPVALPPPRNTYPSQFSYQSSPYFSSPGPQAYHFSIPTPVPPPSRAASSGNAPRVPRPRFSPLPSLLQRTQAAYPQPNQGLSAPRAPQAPPASRVLGPSSINTLRAFDFNAFQPGSTVQPSQISTAQIADTPPLSSSLAPQITSTRGLVSGNKMVGKKSGKALLREEGLARTDNGMKQTSWPEIGMINQKNYYTEFMKRDDQILAYRTLAEANRDKMIREAKDRDRALARTGDTEVPLPTNGDGDLEDDETAANDDVDPSKILVIHPGSQNLRIGFASDALPKTVPMVLAIKWKQTESDEYGVRPNREEDTAPEQLFGDEFSKKFTKMSNDLKLDMRANKRKVLPNSKELVVNYNRRTEPEKIPEHNDPMRVEWTDIAAHSSGSWLAGMKALRIPDDSNPKYKVFRPISYGWFNERDYLSQAHLENDIESIIEDAMINELGLTSSIAWEQYSCVFVIPDMYDKRYVEFALKTCLSIFKFKQVAFIQESLAATFGAGYTMGCVVDIGAQKTSIACVEDGMLHEDSRVNLKYGGYDVTQTFVKMLLYDHFPYADINLNRRYDFLLAEELKMNFCTMNQADISPQLYNFHLRAPNQPTHKYQFKTYDEVILAPMGYFDPSLFENSEKLIGRRSLLDRSYNAYDVDTPDDPVSAAQLAILTAIKPSLASTTNGFSFNNGSEQAGMATPSKEKSNPLSFLSRPDPETNGNSRVTSAAGSPAPEGTNTPVPSGPFVFGANGTNGGSPGPTGSSNLFQFGGSHNSGTPVPPAGMFIDQLARTQKDLAIERDSVLPISPLDTAIITSITHAAKGDEKKVRDLFGQIMVIGGGAKTPGFSTYLEEKLKARRPDLADKVTVSTSAKEMDGQVVVWKGASVYANLKTHESWIGKTEYERLGSRVLHHKVLWNY